MSAAALTLGKMRLVRDRMLESFPFYAHVLARGRFQVERVGTMAVTIRGGELYFLLDPRFVAKHSLDELAAVLEHEVNHIVLGHLEVDRSAYTDQPARILSEEVTANEFVRGTLPGRPHLLADYDLPEGESTDTRYATLAGRKKSVPKRANSVQDRTSSAPTPGDSAPAPRRSVPPKRIRTTDNHLVWPGSGEDVATVVMNVLTSAAAATPLASVPAIIRERLTRRASPTVVESLPLVGAPEEAQLLAALRRHEREVADFRRPSRRLPHLVGIVPRTARKPLRILFAVDTSASIAIEVLARVSAIIRRVAQTHDVTVVEADDVIRRTYRYTGPITFVHGRGSTDLRPPLANLILSRFRPDVVIFATDGDGPAPASAPAAPVIWLITPGGVAPATWGRAVHLR